MNVRERVHVRCITAAVLADYPDDAETPRAAVRQYVAESDDYETVPLAVERAAVQMVSHTVEETRNDHITTFRQQ